MNKKTLKNSEIQGDHVSLSEYWYFRNNNKNLNTNLSNVATAAQSSTTMH